MNFLELIKKVQVESESAMVYFIGVDNEFLTDFLKSDFTIQISIFDAGFKNEFRKSDKINIVFQVPEEDKSYSRLLHKLIESIRARKFIIILAKTLSSLIQYFSFFAENKFTKIFGTIGNTSSYAYMPYADNPIQELVSNSGHLPDAWKDFNGFALRTIIQEDVPRTFWYRNEKGQKCIGGKYGEIILQFLKRHNATFKEIYIRNVTKETYFNISLKNNIDISMNSFLPQENFDFSYPVSIEEMVVMTPVNGLLSPHEYFQRPFSGAVWLCIVGSVFYITIAKIMINKLTTSRIDIWASFSDTFLILLNLPIEKPITSNYRFYLLVLLFAFIIGNLFGAFFQSFLTVFIKIKQYDSIQDLVENNISVIIPNFRWDIIKNKSYPDGLEKIILPTNLGTFAAEFTSMRNTSLAYLIEEDTCLFYIGFQSLYRKSLFRVARETICSHHFGYLLPPNSPFKDILNYFIVEIKQTGLLEKWDKDVFYQAKGQGVGSTVYKDYVHEEAHVPLTLHQLQFAWNILVIGLSISTVVFVIECVFKKFLFFLILRTHINSYN
ncbi:uncharacterized protein LOC129912649 [Episyrphus balteatus]|uniref:uncharacterized protein LOC129912649 n=1 Tax=Episyrphus balteatus TaxID=286459 RepID=UPI0024858615|nr:uncharacterized protein LOC129912649 [Episyrphus balteatus]